MLTPFFGSLSGLDSLIIGIYLLISVALGLFARHAIKTMSDFVTAGQRIHPFLGVASLAGTEMGLITIMYSAQKGFSGGFAAFHIALVAGCVTFFVGITGFIVVPLRKSGVLTIPEYYQRRFDTKTRLLGGIMLAFGGILNMGLFLKVGAIFLIGITGLSEHSHLLMLVMSALLILVLIYTVLGGMVSVILTDYLQFVVLSIGLLGVVGASIYKLGWHHIFNSSYALLGEAGVNPFSNSGDFGIGYIIWMIFTAGLVSCAIWPTAVARALSMKHVHAVKTQYMLSSVAFMVRFLIPQFLGICALVYFTSQSISFQFGSNPGEVSTLYAFPLYLKSLVPIGILGLISAAMLAAFMSTHDSYLLCWASVIIHDVIAPIMKKRNKPLSDQTCIMLTRYTIIGIGLYVWYWGLFYQGRDDIWDYMAITGAIYFTGAFSVLLGGLYWPKASSTGAFLALLAGCSAIFGLEPIRNACGISHLSGATIGLFSVSLTLIVLILGSFAFPDTSTQRAIS